MPSVLGSVRHELAALDASPAALRRFALAVGGVFGALSALLAWRAGGVSAVSGTLAILGTTLLVLRAVAPRALLGPFRVWMGVALLLGFVMTRVILTVAFVVAFVPLGLAFRLMRRDVLGQRPDPAAGTYWVSRTDGPSGRERMGKMF